MNNLFVILLIVTLALSSNIESYQSVPLLIEYITPFDTPVNDLQVAINNQLSRNDFLTTSFTTDHVKVTNLIYKSTHNTSKTIIDPKQQSYKHIVSNDGIDLHITYQAVINPNLPDHRQYKGNTYVKIYVNYTKEIDEEGVTEVLVSSVYVDNKSFVMDYSGSPSANDLKRLHQINNGVVSGKHNTTILMLLQTQQFTKQTIQKLFLQNLKVQKISPTYNQQYNYKFNDLNVTFDMSTIKIKPNQKGITNFIKGGIKNYNMIARQDNHDLQRVDQVGEYNMLITIDFLSNFIKYCTEQYKSWQNLKINQQTYPNPLFKFKLIDLENIISNVLSKYSKYYLNSFNLICQIKSTDEMVINEHDNNLNLNALWRCNAFLDGPTPSPLIMDFNIILKYVVEISSSYDILNVMVTDSRIFKLQINPVQNFEVIDSYMFELYIKEIIKRFNTFTVGSNFKIRSGSRNVVLRQNQGIYIG